MGIDEFIKNFSYETRKDMKIKSKDLIELLKQGKALLVDIRFKEEYEAWNVQPSVNIPLNELPDRLEELKQTDKLIVLACPHNERSAIAMTYLRSKGIYAKYLADGLLTMVDILRGDNAKDYTEGWKKLKD
jgi:rhodanese-related sulfurtransferase